MFPIYANTADAATNTQSFTSDGGEFIAFYRAAEAPTLPVTTGITFVDYVGGNGAQGVQGRFLIRIFRRFATTATNPTGGSYDADTGVLTPPADWFLDAGDATGTDTLYVSDTTIDPAVMITGTTIPIWTGTVQAGGTGPEGPAGTVPLVTSLTGIANATQGVILTTADTTTSPGTTFAPGYYYRTTAGGTWIKDDTDTNTGVMTVSGDNRDTGDTTTQPVSYTHLTLPTNREV